MPKHLRINSSNFIDETTRVSFKFDGKTYYGFKGDTLASALIANGIHLVARSFKYHRPRGIMTAGSEEPNAIVQINGNTAYTEPNVRATEIEIYDGLEASSQNCWPNVNFDIGGINNILSPLLPAGFYYKTFMWPASFWEKYEYFIRKSAGLGKSPTKPDPDLYEHKYIHCDVLVIGGGISGIMAAKTAAENNYKTLLLDEKPHLGGTTIYQSSEFNKINNQYSSKWLENEISKLKNIKNLEIKTRTSVAAYHGYNFLLARENLTDHLPLNKKKDKIRQRLLKIRAKKVIEGNHMYLQEQKRRILDETNQMKVSYADQNENDSQRRDYFGKGRDQESQFADSTKSHKRKAQVKAKIDAQGYPDNL